MSVSDIAVEAVVFIEPRICAFIREFYLVFSLQSILMRLPNKGKQCLISMLYIELLMNAEILFM